MTLDSCNPYHSPQFPHTFWIFPAVPDSSLFSDSPAIVCKLQTAAQSDSIHVCMYVYIHILLSALQQKYSHLSLYTFSEFQTSLLWLLHFGSYAIVTPTSPV